MESLNEDGPHRFKVIELVIKKEQLDDGKYKFLEIEKVKLSSVLNVNSALAGLQPPHGESHPGVFEGNNKDLPLDPWPLLEITRI